MGWIIIAWLLFQPPGVQRQTASADRQRASAARQAHSVEKQLASARKQSSTAIPLMPTVEAASPVVAAWPVMDPDCLRLSDTAMDTLVQRGAQANLLSPRLLREVIRRESDSVPCAVSRAGAMGLMQLMPETADSLGIADPFDPAQNIAGGGRYLRALLDRYGGDLELALGAYNAGPGRVDRAGGIPLFPETQDYVSSIMKRIEIPVLKPNINTRH